MDLISKTLHTGRTLTTGDRDNAASRSFDGLLDIKLSKPGSKRIGTNPEQLFAAGWSASFADAIAIAARKKNIMIPTKVSIDAQIDLNLANDGYFLSARLSVTIPGLEHEAATELIGEAEKSCPYSKAIHGNVKATVTLV
jgi:osmotically inducible protein OsmC